MIVAQVFFEDINNEKNKEAFKNYLRGKDLMFVGVGTTKAYLDSCGPKICSELKRNNLTVFGTVEDQFHGTNIERKINVLNDIYKNKFKIAIDSCVSEAKEINSIILDNEGLKPGAGMNKIFPRVGDFSLKIVMSDSADEIIKYTTTSNCEVNELKEVFNRVDRAVQKTYTFIMMCLRELENEMKFKK